MNKAKLVELAEEVLTDIDVNIKSFVRKKIIIKIIYCVSKCLSSS
jgi:hypothetical protein